MPDKPRTHAASDGSVTVAAAWVDGNIGKAILAASALGLSCVLGAMASYHRWCGPNDSGICLLAKESPPWVLLAGLAAAPAVLLTWYWRTTQRRRELDLKHRELDQKDEDHRLAVEARGAQELAAVESELTTFERGVITPDFTAAILLIEQTNRLMERARSKDVCVRVAKGVERGLRHHQQTELSQVDTVSYSRFAEAALRLLSEAQRELDPPIRISLRGIRLQTCDLDGCNLQKVDFSGSTLLEVSFDGADLSGAKFNDCQGCLVRTDETTVLDDDQRAQLRRLARPPGRPPAEDGDD